MTTMTFQVGDRVRYTGLGRSYTSTNIGKCGVVTRRNSLGPYVRLDGRHFDTATFDENLEHEYSANADPEVNAALRDEVAMRCFADSIEMNPQGVSREEWYGRWARESYAAAEAFLAERTRRYGKEKGKSTREW